ncbi:S1/P1 nuclease [Syncephalis fuscata]|nr:S1/P1 nuclease [Syncephalis fuscata]
MLKFVTLLSALCIASASFANAWTDNGHSAVAVLATKMLTPNAYKDIQDLLSKDKESNGDIKIAANWGDNIKSNKSYDWAKNLHFVNTIGDSPTTCKSYESSDCTGGRCIVTAMQNFTEKASCEASKTQRIEALKFLLHLLGDIAQPLHITGVALGGNKTPCKWGNNNTNLHLVWDMMLVDKTINNNFNNYTWSMANEINSGKYSGKKAEWMSCFKQKPIDLNACVIEWVNESNQFNCNTLFPMFYKAVESGNSDLSTKYYDDNKEYINTFVARGAVRAASYLNAVFGHC